MKMHTYILKTLTPFSLFLSLNMQASSFFDDLLGSGVSNATTQSSTASSRTRTRGISESKAQSYVASLVRTLRRAFSPYMKKNALTALENAITYNALNGGTTYEWGSNGKQFNTDLIDQVIASLVLQSIEESAYEYAYKKSHSSTFATQVATSMRNNALARMDSRGALAFDTLVTFIGSSMEKEVERLLACQGYNTPKPNQNSYSSDYSRPSAPVQFESASYDFKTYPSNECAVCYDDLTAHSRVFLKPCGHDMCKNCASTWFFTNNKKSCPQCRSTVDRDHLSFALATL